jgi:hypothetical protein
MAFALGELADLLHEGKRFPEIAESKRALDEAHVPNRSYECRHSVIARPC